MAEPVSKKMEILEVDGVSEEFFNLLWMKDELNFGPNVCVPDTVIFRHGMPSNWYFTASNGRVKRKNRTNLISSRIEDVFTKHILGYDILATFISFPEVQKEGSPVVAKPFSVIQYLDRDGLYDFLYKTDKTRNGILQRFIEPKGTKNEVIRAIWSPKLCLLERAENIYQLHDQRYGLYERCVTFEGPEYYCVSSPLRGTVLAGQVQKVCETVVSHISEVTFATKQITRIVLNFKVDSRDKLWLMYTTSIRLGNTDALETVEQAMAHFRGPKNLISLNSGLVLPDVVNLNPQPSYDEKGTKKQRSRIRCVSCSNETLDDVRHTVTYKSVLKHYEHVLHLLAELPADAATAAARKATGSKGVLLVPWPPDPQVVAASGGVGFGCLDLLNDDLGRGNGGMVDLKGDGDVRIPPILRYLHPRLNSTGFARCRQDPLFLYKTVTVCEACFLVYAEFTTMYLQMGKGIHDHLRPEPTQGRLKSEAEATAARPSSADWRAMSSVHRPQSPSDLRGLMPQPALLPFHPSENHLHAKESAIGIRTSETYKPPDLPPSVRSGNDTASVFGQLAQNIHTQSQSLIGRGGSLSPKHAALLERSMSLLSDSKMSEYDGDAIAATAAERERNFFKEIARNPQLRDQHPLMHLISAQQKLLMTTQQSGVVMSKAAAKSEGIWEKGYGKQSTDKFSALASYKEELPYLIRGQHILPSKLKQQREVEKMKKKEDRRAAAQRQALLMSLSGGMSSSASGGPGGPGSVPATLTGSKGSSDTHRAFLHGALQSIEEEIKNK